MWVGGWLLKVVFLFGLIWALPGLFSYGTLIWSQRSGDSEFGSSYTCTYLILFNEVVRTYTGEEVDSCPFFIDLG